MNLLFLDLDGTARETKSGAAFINDDPSDQQLIPGVYEVLEKWSKSYYIYGVTNQKGVSLGFKTLENCIEEQRITLDLIPWMDCILFCPDDGDTCYRLFRNMSDGQNLLRHDRGSKFASFRKPGHGMIQLALHDFVFDIGECVMVGDRIEDQECSMNANINFIWAENWRDGFSFGTLK